MFNRMGNCGNRYQGAYKKVLCVCSAGLLRSPTTAVVLSQEPYNYNTRAVGVDTEFALVPIDEVHYEWADEIVCMEKYHAQSVKAMFGDSKKVVVLDLPDNFAYRDPELIRLIREKYDAKTSVSKED